MLPLQRGFNHDECVMSGEVQEVGRLLVAAQQARMSGDRHREGGYLEQAFRLAPRDPRVANASGMRALALEDWQDARAKFEMAIDADPAEPALWMNLASAYRAMGDDRGEERSLEGALAIDRRHVMAQYRMADLHQRNERKAKAVEHWSNLVQLLDGVMDGSPQVQDMRARAQTYLADHRNALSAALEQAFDGRVSALGSEKKRFQACIDHSLGRRRIYQNICAGIHYPFLPAEEFFDRSHFPWFAELEAKVPQIRAEAQAILNAKSDLIRPYVRIEQGSPETKWSALDNNLDWTACFLWEYGVRNDPVCHLCPETAKALEAVPQTNIPGKAPSAFFSLLRPGAHIPAHTGVTNTRTIIHLPLIVPADCGFRVGGETREWREGEAFAFDDTIEHEAWNRSDRPRIVLIFDVWNPYLTAVEQELLSEMFVVTENVT